MDSNYQLTRPRDATRPVPRFIPLWRDTIWSVCPGKLQATRPLTSSTCEVKGKMRCQHLVCMGEMEADSHILMGYL